MSENKKIANLWLPMRCTKELIQKGNKKFNVYVIRDTHARFSLYGIVVNKDVYKVLNEDEQIALLYHEEYHMKISTILMRLLNFKRFINEKRENWEEEFNADKYSAIVNSKESMLSALEKLKCEYEENNIAYNSKTHQPIEERIKRISELK